MINFDSILDSSVVQLLYRSVGGAMMNGVPKHTDTGEPNGGESLFGERRVICGHVTRSPVDNKQGIEKKNRKLGTKLNQIQLYTKRTPIR